MMIDTVLEYNEQFVKDRKYEEFRTTKFPNKKMVIVTCMDTRLIELLPQSMNLRNGDAKIIKNAGGVISHPFGSAMRSILVALYELKASEVCVIMHHGCGMNNINSVETIKKMQEGGVSKQTFDTLEFAGIDIEKWLAGFENVEDSVRNSVNMIKKHPLLPIGTPVHGLVIDPETGKLDVVVKDDVPV
ncbi:beta-class carbonic anhydrase [Sporosarcina soli]|uniref:carbonic anhydrase n=1 Tax=Sporosarcina soli TaxID=334736 RepID=A0ABW0TFA4_9BACL